MSDRLRGKREPIFQSEILFSVHTVVGGSDRGHGRATSLMAPYLPRLVRGWSEEPDAPRARTLDGTLVSIDISGFTALAERLSAKGKAGAEELVQRISACSTS